MFRLVLLLLLLTVQFCYGQIPHSPLSDRVSDSVWPKLSAEMCEKHFKPGAPLFLRIFKQERNLEVWMLKSKRYVLFKTYPICTFSGGLGTKNREGDGKSPEGFYTITSRQLNPFSSYRLAVNIGYPNAMERANNCTGNAIMIHGGCASIGCYAMTDGGIDEIYTMILRSLQAGQRSIELHIMPYRFGKVDPLTVNSASTLDLWKNIKTGYDLFERDHIPPAVSVSKRRYVFNKI